MRSPAEVRTGLTERWDNAVSKFSSRNVFTINKNDGTTVVVHPRGRVSQDASSSVRVSMGGPEFPLSLEAIVYTYDRDGTILDRTRLGELPDPIGVFPGVKKDRKDTPSKTDVPFSWSPPPRVREAYLPSASELHIGDQWGGEQDEARRIAHRRKQLKDARLLEEEQERKRREEEIIAIISSV
jgi:hypothetical protein